MARNQFECLKYEGINVANVPAKQLTLQETVRTPNICGGQGLRCKSACYSHKSCSSVDN